LEDRRVERATVKEEGQKMRPRARGDMGGYKGRRVGEGRGGEERPEPGPGPGRI